MQEFKHITVSTNNHQRVIDGLKFPCVWTPTTNFNFYQLQEYFMKNNLNITKQLNQNGAIFFTGFDIRSPNELATIINKFGKNSFDYIGGAAVRTLIIGTPSKNTTKNVQVFTTNQSPPTQVIPFHNQLLQTPNYPDYLVFYCYSEADTGGSTPIVNCHQLYKYIEAKHPQFLERLNSLGVRYIRVVGSEDNPESPIGRGWKNIFKVESKEEAQLQMVKLGYQFKWLEDGDCEIISKRLEGIKVSKSNKKVFCNQMIAVFKGWIDGKNSPSKCLKFGDFSEMNHEVMEDIAKFAQSIKVSMPWKKGDFILIDNQMVAHSRQNFTGNKRKIYASLLKGHKSNYNQTHLTLKSGQQMPLLGFGTWKIPKNLCSEVVYNALKAGYRLLDCACDYGNESYVGQGLTKAINQNIVKREEVFITSKLWNSFHRPEHVKTALLKTIKDLGVDYLDLYLMHFPIATKYVPIEVRYPPEWFYDLTVPNPCMEEDNVPLIQTWRAMQSLVREGLVKNIGVSNFCTVLLRDLINSASIQPSVLQIEIHPFLTQKKLIRFCREKGIQVTSFSTFGASSYIQLSMATKQQTISQNSVVLQIAKNKQKTPYQIALRWAVQQGLAVIPKTINQDRLHENRDILGWELTEEQMVRIDGLNQNKRFNDPGVFCELAFKTFFPIYE